MLVQYLLGCWARSRHTVDTKKMPHLSVNLANLAPHIQESSKLLEFQGMICSEIQVLFEVFVFMGVLHGFSSIFVRLTF